MVALVMLMPIGRFAGATRLSVKTLRNYDAAGLLPAARVDPVTGYRYYRPEQLAQASVIRSLRSLGVGLADIALVLAGRDVDEVLASRLGALERERAELDRTALRVQHLLATKELSMSDSVTLKQVPAQLTAAYATSTTMQTVFADIPAGFQRVFQVLDAIQPTGAPITVFRRIPDAESPGELLLCVPVAEPVEERDGVRSEHLDAAVVASLVHRGSYTEMDASYATIGRWIQEHGHRVTGASREIYLNSPADVPVGELLTEIQWPVDDDGGQ